MKSKNLIAKILFFSFVLLSCGNIIDRQKNLSTEDRINDEMSKLPLPSQMPEGEFDLESNPADPDYLPDDENYVYQKKQYYAVPEGATYFADGLPSQLLWPGAIIDSSSFVNGASVEISSPKIVRAPLTILLDTGNASNEKSVTIEHPNAESVKKAMNDLIQRGGTQLEATKKYSRFVFSEFKTKSEFDTKIKTTVGSKSSLSNDLLSALAEKSAGNKKTKVLLEYTQCFFSIKPTMLSKSSDFFNLNETNWNDIAPVLQGSRAAPVFISSVDYGKSMIAVIESDEEYAILKSGIEAFGDYLEGSIDEDVQNAVNSIKMISTITMVVLGENGEKVGDRLLSYKEITSWLCGDESEKHSKPIRYSLQYINNLTTFTRARFVVGGDFYRRDYLWNEIIPEYRGGGEYNEIEKRLEIPSTDNDLFLGVFILPSEPIIRISGRVVNGKLTLTKRIHDEMFDTVSIDAGNKFCILFWEAINIPVITQKNVGCSISDLKFEKRRK
jgi:hypothetical protein